MLCIIPAASKRHLRVRSMCAFVAIRAFLTVNCQPTARVYKCFFMLQGGRKQEGELQRMARNLTVAIAPDDFKPANELEPGVSAPLYCTVILCLPPRHPQISLGEQQGAGQASWLSQAEACLVYEAMGYQPLRT